MTTSQPQGYLAIPTSGKGRGVLVLHAWWGLNPTIKDLSVTGWQIIGFISFAPDLYHGKVADTIPGAETLVSALDGNELSRPKHRNEKRLDMFLNDQNRPKQG